VVQELCRKLTDLEAKVVPTTPLEELESREAKMKATMSRLSDFERKCQQLYNHGGKTWNRWIEDEDLKQTSRNVIEVHV